MNQVDDFYQQQVARQQVEDNYDNQLSQRQAMSMFSDMESQNLIKWQLDIKEELERIERLLRRQVVKSDDKGNTYYAAPEEGQELFNERGINEVMNLLNWYLNKNIILSNFEIKEIAIRMLQFSDELNDLIFNNYEDFGLTTLEKMKHYPMVHMNIVNTVEAAYMRALNGGERESLRTARTVNQTEPLQQYPMNMMPQEKKKFSIINPRTW